MAFKTGRHFLQIPGPTTIPDRVLRAMDRPVLDHRGPEMAALGHDVLAKLGPVFGTTGPVVVFPSSGTGAWEAAIVNTLSVGDRVLVIETGQFAQLWKTMAERFGLIVDWMEGDWRHGIDPDAIEAHLRADTGREIKAVLAVHNETSTGITSRIPEVRAAMDRADHGALLMVDTISGVGSIPYEHDAWRVDVTIAGSQKGLMMPAGLGFNAVSSRALRAGHTSGMARSYWDWADMLAPNATGFFPYTPAVNLMFGLQEAMHMLAEETLPAVHARHARLAAATRAAVAAWGLGLQAADPREYSDVVTAVVMPDGYDADALRALILDRYDMSLGAGLGRVKGRVFRIGHVGHLNELMMMGALSGVEMGLQAMAVPHRAGGAQAAMELLARPAPALRVAAE